jgi:predicted dehydrogenase
MGEVRIGLIGTGFMGKAHSNAWMMVNKFFKPGAKAVMRACCSRNEAGVSAFAEHWGWQSWETDWRRLIARDDIDAVDITVPNNAHAEVAIEAARHGKHITCEKPLAMSLKEALTMLAAVRKAKVRNMVWHNYRRVPAIQLARQIIKEGRLGRIFHIRAVYLQDWIINPDFPLVWRLQKEICGTGSHGDLNAHIMDTARFITGAEPLEVCAHMETFVKERPKVGVHGVLAATKGKGRGKVTVDDAVIALARFNNGALATFEATRFARGGKNGLGIEVNGADGSVSFNFERMNELRYYNEKDPPHLRGFRNILVTEPGAHKYVDAWWPPGHIIGYENTFVNHAADFIGCIANNKPCSPDFLDSTRNQAFLEAMSISAKRHRWVRVPRIS